jgi:regulatory protein
MKQQKAQCLNKEQKKVVKKLRATCFAMLARREHSQRELLQKLTTKGYEKVDIQELLSEFQEKNWQSDMRFAESYSRSRVNKGFGPTRITLELQERGVDIAFDSLLDELPDWDELLKNLHIKKYGNQSPKDMKERAKRTRFFLHKGYTYDMIKQLFSNMVQ